MRNGPGAGSKELLAGGAEGNRTPDLCSAIAALSHLSYSPAPPAGRRNPRVQASGSGSPSGLFPPLQRLSRESFGPPISGCRSSQSEQERPRRLFVSFARLMTGIRPAFSAEQRRRHGLRPLRSRRAFPMVRRARPQLAGQRAHDNRGGRDERGFWDRASDEVASWFGDEDAERRRRQDTRHDERMGDHRDAADWRGLRPRLRPRLTAATAPSLAAAAPTATSTMTAAGSARRRIERARLQPRLAPRTLGQRKPRRSRAGSRQRPRLSADGRRLWRGHDHESDQFFAASGYGVGERGFGDYDRSQTPYGRDEYRRTSFAGSPTRRRARFRPALSQLARPAHERSRPRL